MANILQFSVTAAKIPMTSLDENVNRVRYRQQENMGHNNIEKVGESDVCI